jgi:hypothetical protein
MVADTFELIALAAVAQLQPLVNATPASTTTNGTPTSGTTETEDAVLGTYQCNLISGRRYMAVMNGLVGNGSVVSDVFLLNIRNSGSSSAPTSSSTLVAQQEWTPQTAGTSGRSPIPLAGSFIAPATGLNTFAFFAQRTAGTGVFTPISPLAIARELFVMYLGAV